MSNRFQESAKRIIDGNFGSLKEPLIIYQSDGYDYNTQTSIPQTIIGITALRGKLRKSDFENDLVQQGDFTLTTTDPVVIDVDNQYGDFNGTAVTFVDVSEGAGGAYQRIIARLK